MLPRMLLTPLLSLSAALPPLMPLRWTAIPLPVLLLLLLRSLLPLPFVAPLLPVCAVPHPLRSLLCPRPLLLLARPLLLLLPLPLPLLPLLLRPPPRIILPLHSRAPRNPRHRQLSFARCSLLPLPRPWSLPLPPPLLPPLLLHCRWSLLRWRIPRSHCRLCMSRLRRRIGCCLRVRWGERRANRSGVQTQTMTHMPLQLPPLLSPPRLRRRLTSPSRRRM